MIVGYARVSTDQQLLDSQLNALKAAGCEKIYSDTDISGSKKSRPSLDACIADLKAGDTLVIYKLDRLGRNTRHLLELVQDVIQPRGVTLKSITESIDTSNYMGQFFFTLIAALAEMERARIIERVNAGLKAARARGVRLGKKSVIQPDVVDRARMLIGSGSSVEAAAKSVGISRASLYRLL